MTSYLVVSLSWSRGTENRDRSGWLQEETCGERIDKTKLGDAQGSYLSTIRPGSYRVSSSGTVRRVQYIIH